MRQPLGIWATENMSLPGVHPRPQIKRSRRQDIRRCPVQIPEKQNPWTCKMVDAWYHKFVCSSAVVNCNKNWNMSSPKYLRGTEERRALNRDFVRKIMGMTEKLCLSFPGSHQKPKNMRSFRVQYFLESWKCRKRNPNSWYKNLVLKRILFPCCKND